MSIVTFQPVKRQGANVIITAFSESGCGKTLSLLKIGRGLVGPNGKLGMLDTERGRGRIYEKAITGGYLYAELTPPFSPERYIEAIEEAEQAGIQALLIDSGSHEWDGFGGLLEIADDGKDSQGRALQGLIKWAKPKARHRKYTKKLLNLDMHLLIALRAKEKMIQVGGKIPIPPGSKSGDIISDGFVPIQDKSFVFDTTVQLFFSTKGDRGIPVTDQGPRYFKCPEDLRPAFPDGEKITEKTGELIAAWVAGGEPIDHALIALRRAAEEAAGGGRENLRRHFKGLSREHRAQLADHTDNLASIADTADKEQGSQDSPADGPGGDQPTKGVPRPFPTFEDGVRERLAAAASVAEVNAISDDVWPILENKAKTPHDLFLALSEAIDTRRAELAEEDAA